MKNIILLVLTSLMMFVGFSTHATGPMSSSDDGQLSDLNGVPDIAQPLDSDTLSSDAAYYPPNANWPLYPPYRNRCHYGWRYSYVDRSGGCNSCAYSCDAPCRRGNVGQKKSCRVQGTHNDRYVYVCSRRCY